jgi:hypothetical protein
MIRDWCAIAFAVRRSYGVERAARVSKEAIWLLLTNIFTLNSDPIGHVGYVAPVPVTCPPVLTSLPIRAAQKDETVFCVESDLVFVGVSWFVIIITWRSGWAGAQQARLVHRL